MVDQICSIGDRAKHLCFVCQCFADLIICVLAAIDRCDIWDVQNTLLSGLLTGLYFFGWFTVLFGTFLINHFNLFGLQQVYNNLNNKEPGTLSFVTPLFYKIVRHPIMLGFIIAFWSSPLMTTGHILFSVATTAYILIAIQLEERDMVGVYGAEYKRYQREVSQIVPLPPKNR